MNTPNTPEISQGNVITRKCKVRIDPTEYYLSKELESLSLASNLLSVEYHIPHL